MHDRSECCLKIEKETQYKIEQNLPELLSIYCNHCRTITTHRTIVRATTHCVDGSEDDPIFFTSQHRIVECAGCHSVRFVEHTTEDGFPDDYGCPDKLHCHIYPISEEGALTESRLYELQWSLPNNVKKIYFETVAAIKNKLFILAGIGLRTILDTVCREKGIGAEKNNLKTRIEIMYTERHLITEDEKSILHSIRNFGNDSAHEGKRMTSYTVSSALIVMEHLLDKLYRLPEIKKEFDEGKEKISFFDKIFSDNGEVRG